MSNFSTQACYAVLSTYTSDGESPLQALLKMVVTLVDERKYAKIDPQDMVADFYKKYHFRLPYHPMQIVINLGIDEGYFEYNSSLGVVHPIWGAISSDEFMKIFNQRESEYKDLLRKFDQFLQEKYDKHCSMEDLSDRVQAFIQRYGLIAKTDKTVLKKVQNDYLFAEYLLYCQENGDSALLEYIDAYITGCAFEELLTFDAPTQQYKSCKAKGYLDTGFIFSLLGIESKDRSESFEELLRDMIHLGMEPYIFEHTYGEISGIIDAASSWIGNPEYDPSVASEATHFFVSNSWSRQKVDELLGDLKRLLIEEYQIKIDNTPYPRAEDIRTTHQENIKQLIVNEYSGSNPRFSAEEKAQTIELDSRSLFMLLHFNDGYIAHTLPDLKYIFVTTNRSLARVGRNLMSGTAYKSTRCIPIALNDLVWGTLVWSHSPAKISEFNKANIISAAFAAFQPSTAILKKLNETLIECAAKGEIQPETCYFLKTNAMALKTLSQLTQNEENRYSEKTPLEILQRLKQAGYQEGVNEKQKEVDKLIEEKKKITFQNCVDKQKEVVRELTEKKGSREKLLSTVREVENGLKNQLESLEIRKSKGDKKYRCLSALLGGIIILIAAFCAVIANHLYQGSKTFEAIISTCGFITPIIMLALYVINSDKVTLAGVAKAISVRIRKYAYDEYSFDENEYERIKGELQSKNAEIADIQSELVEIADDLKRESAKVDDYSVDIDVIKLVTQSEK